MMQKNRKNALAVAISSALWGTAVYAQEPAPTTAPDMVEEIVVKGVRASQAKAIDIKRTNVNVVDSIVAEDIGKLPDSTITDSLQRVTGVQIKREANEGTSLNVRGMPQVLSTLNGEQFLSPWNITDVGANYGDIPAGMIGGVDVYKSQSANTLAGGIAGVVDLKTLRPLSLKDGFTGNLKLEASQGSLSKKEINSDGSAGTRKPDENISAFLGFNNGGDIGVTLGAFTQSSYNANYKLEVKPQLGFRDTRNGTSIDPLDLDSDGDLVNDWYLAPENYSASSNFMTRERTGGSFSIEAAVGDFVKVRGDVFYTHMEQFDRGVSVNFDGANNVYAYQVNGNASPNPWTKNEWRNVNGEVVPADTAGAQRGDGVYQDANGNYYPKPSNIDAGLYNTLLPGTQVGIGSDFSYIDDMGQQQTRSIHTLKVAEVLSPAFESKSSNGINRTGAINSNFQVDYDNQDNIKATLRFVHAEAEKEYREANLKQGSPAWLWPDLDGSPGKDPLTPYRLTVDYTGEFPSFSYDGDISDASKLALYQADAKGNNTEATLDVLRADINFAFDGDLVSSVDVGFRHGIRDAEYNEFYYVTPTGRYEDNQRIPITKRGQLLAGNQIWQRYPDFRYFDYTNEPQVYRDAGLHNNEFTSADPAITVFKDFGPFKGFEKGVSALDPATWDNPLEFMNRLYGNGEMSVKTVDDPANAYSVEEASTSAYFQLNLDDTDGIMGIPYKGNVGLQILSTDRTVDRHNVPEVLDIYNSIGYQDYQKLAFVYDVETKHKSFVQTLPSLNLNFFPKDDVVVRFGAAKTTTRNNLENVGSGLNLWYTECEKKDENGNRVLVLNSSGQLVGDKVTCTGGGNDKGNIDIKPWSANVYNLAAEWYFEENAILGVGLFKIDVDSAVQNFQERRNFLDGDGIDRGNTGNVWVSQNVGASSLYGLEMGYKQPFTFLPGAFLSATGVELNYTYSKNESADRDIQGNVLPLQSNSEHQSNFILWYDKSGLNVRLAYNWKSKEFDGFAGLNTSGQAVKLASWIEPQAYLDLSVSYWVNEHFSLFVNGTNLTEQSKKSYAQYSGQLNSIWVQERRYSAGITLSL
ncbi:MAG: TonB-dependent receptor [Pseudomonadota bacterium]